MHLSQRGAAQILLPLFLIAAVALTVYIAQQRTNLIPFAADGDCTPKNATLATPDSASTGNVNPAGKKETVNGKTKAYIEKREQWIEPDGSYVIKFTWTDGRISWDFKNSTGVLDSNGYALSRDGKCTKVKKTNGKGQNLIVPAGKDAAVLTKFEDGTEEYNYFIKKVASGPNEESNWTYDVAESYSLYGGTTGSGKTGDACTQPSDCQSGTCTNEKCASQGSKAGGDACTKGVECQSGTCTNSKCAGGSSATGKACDDNSDCASNKCENNKCVAVSASGSPKSSSSPKASSGSSGNNGGNNSGGGSGGTSSPTPTTSIPPASVAPSASVPTANTPGTGAPVSLTKAEITSFKASFDALYTRLGTAKDTGNLKIVADIANTELASIASQLSTCPDDANVGPCLDSKFRTRFDLAKTAARLAAFYGIFNNVSGLCVKSDFGLNPLITATSTTSASGRVNLCSEPTAARRIWKIFVNSKFEDILTTDTRFPANPTCATLPSTEPVNVMDHYRKAEALFSTQPGFIANTLCDGKISVAPGSGI